MITDQRPEAPRRLSALPSLPPLSGGRLCASVVKFPAPAQFRLSRIAIKADQYRERDKPFLEKRVRHDPTLTSTSFCLYNQGPHSPKPSISHLFSLRPLSTSSTPPKMSSPVVLREFDPKNMPFRRLGPSGLRVSVFSLGGCTSWDFMGRSVLMRSEFRVNSWGHRLRRPSEGEACRRRGFGTFCGLMLSGNHQNCLRSWNQHVRHCRGVCSREIRARDVCLSRAIYF
jgi:hypothetical protein